MYIRGPVSVANKTGFKTRKRSNAITPNPNIVTGYQYGFTSRALNKKESIAKARNTVMPMSREIGWNV